MSGLLLGAELLVALCSLAAAFALIWVAKPKAGTDQPKFSFLKSELGQVLYTVFCICLIAIGLALGFHGVSG